MCTYSLPPDSLQTYDEPLRMTIQILLNNQATALPEGATLALALAQLQPRPPFAVAVNTEFVPKGQYDSRQLQAGDSLEVISPVTGG